ncbi:Low-affinity inorganic phosphate transporter 1 [mine drainage metagenome]|uniref:Low-affinity inorganic phosphate transporter 1 n=1 Tax=mine drainage metagenome TaxID=410659 RepID=A0A1J5RQ68_9ZZZZ
MEMLILIAALFLAFSNGANDNFKGFATVWGSDTLNYRQALALATLATVAGSVAALFLAETLVQNFSGKGLIADAVVNTPWFIFSVASGAAVTVFLATRLGYPVSTTHALIGGLIGAGLAQAGGVHFDKLMETFLMPLLVSPLLAAILGALAYSAFRLRSAEADCVCVVEPELISTSGGIAIRTVASPSLAVGSDEDCATLPVIARFSIANWLNKLHIFSAMAICFARGVNDTPKIAALLLASSLLGAQASFWWLAAAMGLSGVLFARRVAERMSHRVSRMDHSRGLAANLITAVLVLFASKLGVPVSTTHVSVGSIAGVGMRAQSLDWVSLRKIMWSWLMTLPLAAIFAWSVSKLF